VQHPGLPLASRDVEVLGRGPNADLKPLSPSGLVPCLIVGDSGGEAASDGGGNGSIRVWESVAICEFLFEQHPRVWPADRAARAMARSVSCEMAAGFGALRGEMPCNIKMRTQGYPTPYPPALARDIGRVEELVVEARTRFGVPSRAGPFLFGAFSAADAMYAPVATRFRTYNVELASEVAREYFAAVLADAAFREWEESALAEEAKGLALKHYDEATLAKGCGLRQQA